MGYYDIEKNVFDYIALAKDFKNHGLIKKLNLYLSFNKKVLELGMGPGIDLDELKKTYDVTGSDKSRIFLDLYKKKDDGVKLLKLDAVTIDAKSRFDCIYSNKVLHHLSKKELVKSLGRQNNVLKKDGIVLHSFWSGVNSEKFGDLLFTEHTLPYLVKIFIKNFEILEIGLYTEMEKEDSIYVVARKKISF